MWCHEGIQYAQTIETTMVLIGQSRAPSGATSSMARPTLLSASKSAKRLGTLKKSVRHASSVSFLTSSATGTRRRTRRII